MFPSLEDFREMAQHTESGILIHEAASKNILWANPAACRMFGFTLEELRPLKAHHMSSTEQQYRRELGVAWLQDAVNHGISRKQWKYRNKAGQDFLTDAVATRVRFADGWMVMVQFRNIAEEVSTAQELVRTTDYLSRIMMYASAGILLLDEEWCVQDASPMVAGLFGLTSDELSGRDLRRLARITLESGGELDWERIDDVGLGEVMELRLEVVGEAGRTWLSGQIEDVEHDGIHSRMLALRDITNKVELQQRADYQEANLQYLARFNAMGDMAMTIAHELGQPLAAAGNFLSGLLSRLESGRLSEADFRYGLERALVQVTRTADIVASVKRYVQRIETPVARHDLNEIITESLYFVRLRAADKDILVEQELSPTVLPVSAESILIGQVIINYCVNAIDEAALPVNPVKRIRVRSFAEGDWVCCSITDWGRGLEQVRAEADEERTRSGARGNRQLVPPFSSKQDGSGIGLVLSERIVERHGGEVVVSDNPEPGEHRGTVITMRLPRAGTAGLR